MMHHWMPFQQLSSRPHAKDKHGGAASIVFQEIHGGMWSKGAWTWLKANTLSGRTNNASKGVDERVWAVQLVEHAGTKSRWGDHHAGGKQSLGRHEAPQAGRPRPADLPYKKHPQCSSSAGKHLFPSPICVLKFLVKNHHRLSHRSQVCLLKQFTPLIHSKSILRSNSWSALLLVKTPELY
jgi:hypothetical protein